MRHRIRRIASVAFALAGMLAAGGRAAAQDYPSRPVRWVVPCPPGGSTDAIARTIAQEMSRLLGAAIVIDDRPGAGGVLGIDAVAKAAPDGCTVLVSDGTLATAPSLRKALPLDPATDLAPVTMFVALPHVVLVNPDLPVRTVREFVALARARPGAINRPMTSDAGATIASAPACPNGPQAVPPAPGARAGRRLGTGRP